VEKSGGEIRRSGSDRIRYPLEKVPTPGERHIDGATPYWTANDYDRLGRKTAMTDPDKGRWRYAYNAFGELVEQIDANNTASTLRYDEHGRRLERIEESARGWRAALRRYTMGQILVHCLAVQVGKLQMEHLLRQHKFWEEVWQL